MIILEDPYVSPELATFAADRQEPVLDTPAARQAGLDYGLHLNLVSSRDFGRLCCRGQRLYSNSENALDWLYSRSGNAGLVRATELLKNKLLFRQRLAPLFPDFHFRELTLRDVMETHFDSLPGPCVLKPAVGFFSLGVYSIENARQWRAARDDIAASAVRWRKEYPAAVLDNQVWLLESLIQGTEYAVDVYFDSRGKAVICNILQHDFASSEDVSDRLYYTSADIIRRMAGPLEDWFDQLNERLGLRDYPVHVELRRDADGRDRRDAIHFVREADNLRLRVEVVGELAGDVLDAHVGDAVCLQDALRRLRAGQPARAAYTGIARKRALDLDLRDERDEQRRHDQHQIRHIKAIIITVVHGSHPF